MRPSRWMTAPFITGAVPRPGPVFPGCQRRNERIKRRRPESNRRAGAMPSPAGRPHPAPPCQPGGEPPGPFFGACPLRRALPPHPDWRSHTRIAVMPPAPMLRVCLTAEREVTAMDRPGKLSARRGGSPGTRTRWRRRTASVHRRDPCPRGGSAPRVQTSPAKGRCSGAHTGAEG